MILRCITEKPTRFRRKTRIKPELLMTNSVWLHPTRVSRGPTRVSQGRETLGSTRSLEAQLGGARQRARPGEPRPARDSGCINGNTMRFSRQTRGLAARRSGPAECRGSPSVVRGRRACPRGAGARSAMFHPQTPFGASQSLPAITKRSAGQNCVFNAACMWGHWGAGGGCPALPPRR